MAIFDYLEFSSSNCILNFEIKDKY